MSQGRVALNGWPFIGDVKEELDCEPMLFDFLSFGSHF